MFNRLSFPALMLAASGALHAAPPSEQSNAPAVFGFGSPASDAEIAAWDVDVAPDGRGLPPGSGTVAQGETLYAARCAKCHGATGREGLFGPLVGREPREGFPFGKHPLLLGARTIGNYWPYATTLYDYLSRAMPFDAPGSLTADEVYALTAYLLYRNEIVPKEAIMDMRTLPRVRMPAHERFVPDERGGGPEVR